MSSGQFVVRMPPDLHAALTAKAAQQGVSLNQLVVTLLAGGIGFTAESVAKNRTQTQGED